ncbi:hypothetical protein GALMADRAFT_210579 [Galerina marginata CBS 339.88]|uniref:Uncharacterized protein n=1 Tax=Galerina marginata (strain CBS 339.88) TaxID=685588 RepID=A0A067T2V5_GALM3|nr:hypothetical protein GALMADRAFT_210579 [Galerina marginata CBS 339.88]
MSATWDYTSLSTYYASTKFPSQDGACKILGLIVVPALKELLAQRILDRRFDDYDFILYRDRRESTSQGGYLVVLAFHLNGDLALKLRIYPTSCSRPTQVIRTAGAIRRFADVGGAVQLPYESFAR